MGMLAMLTACSRPDPDRFLLEPMTLPANFEAAPSRSALPSVQVSPDKSHLIDSNGKPFFLNGDAAWSLIVQVSKGDASVYLENRQRMGFNAVLVNLIEHKYAWNPPQNYYAEPPFVTVGGSRTPNEAYFAHADWVIQEAGRRGITVLLAPIFLGYDCGDHGWCKEVQAASNKSMREYGRYIGRRYRSFPNILWVIGGDTDPAAHGVKTKLDEMVAGIREFDTVHLFTAHNAPDESAQAVWDDSGWLGLNSVYSYDHLPGMVEQESHRTRALPTFLVESTYEGERAFTPFMLRRQMYSTVLWGARAGHVFGNCPIWSFGASATSCTHKGDWREALLHSAGSEDVSRFNRLMTSRHHELMLPDYSHSVMTAGYGSDESLSTTSFASDGSSIIAYIPTHREVTLNFSKLSGTLATAWWFDPRTASARIIGTYSTNMSQTFTTPDIKDWVLVVDAASLHLEAPGVQKN